MEHRKRMIQMGVWKNFEEEYSRGRMAEPLDEYLERFKDDKLADIISSAFFFSKTKLGKRYWYDICRQAKERVMPVGDIIKDMI